MAHRAHNLNPAHDWPRGWNVGGVIFNPIFLKDKIMITPKDIKLNVPRPPVPATVSKDQANNAAMFRGLRELMAVCGENKNDVVDVMINALIDQGANTSASIFDAAVRLECNRTHVAIRLKGGIGVRWTRDSDGIYHNLV